MESMDASISSNEILAQDESDNAVQSPLFVWNEKVRLLCGSEKPLAHAITAPTARSMAYVSPWMRTASDETKARVPTSGGDVSTPHIKLKVEERHVDSSTTVKVVISAAPSGMSTM